MAKHLKTESTSQKWFVLACLVAIPFMVSLDGTIVNVALPVMSKDLHTTLEQMQTVVSSYLVAVVSSILLFGRLGDVVGKGRVFMFGIAVFGIGSLVAGLSHNIVLLNVARVIEGIGGAAAMANNQGIITDVFPENERGRALGISGVFAAVGTMLGPPVGGLIVTTLRWNYIFLINVPVAVIALVAGLKLLPKGVRTKQAVDFLGAGVLAASVILFFVALFTGEKQGYTKPLVLAGMLGGFVLLVLFLIIEKKKAQPILELSLFKNAVFSLSILCVFIQFIVSGGVSILQPVYLEDVMGMNAARSGLVLIAMPIALGITSPISGSLADKHGPAPFTLIGLLVMLCGMVCLSFLSTTTPLWMLILFLALVGMGAGLFAAPNTSMIMDNAPRDKLGIAGSTNGFMRNFGSAVGVSVFSSILYAIMGSQVGHQVTGYVKGKPDVFLNAMHIVYRLGAGLLAIGVVITAIRLIRTRKQAANTIREGREAK